MPILRRANGLGMFVGSVSHQIKRRGHWEFSQIIKPMPRRVLTTKTHTRVAVHTSLASRLLGR